MTKEDLTESDKYSLVEEILLFQEQTHFKVRVDRTYSHVGGGGPIDSVVIAFVLGAIGSGFFSEMGKDLWAKTKASFTKITNKFKGLRVPCHMRITIDIEVHDEAIRLTSSPFWIDNKQEVDKILETMKSRLLQVIQNKQSSKNNRSSESIDLEQSLGAFDSDPLVTTEYCSSQDSEERNKREIYTEDDYMRGLTSWYRGSVGEIETKTRLRGVFEGEWRVAKQEQE